MIVADLLPQSSTFRIPNDSLYATNVLLARIEFMQELQWTLRSLHRPWIGTTGANLARAAVKVAEIEGRYTTLVELAIDEIVAKARKGN